MPKICKKNPKMCHQDLFSSKEAISWIFKSLSFTRQSYKKMKWKSCLHKCIMLKYKNMFQIFFVPKYFWVLEALIFGTLLPDHPVVSFLSALIHFYETFMSLPIMWLWLKLVSILPYHYSYKFWFKFIFSRV